MGGKGRVWQCTLLLIATRSSQWPDLSAAYLSLEFALSHPRIFCSASQFANFSMYESSVSGSLQVVAGSDVDAGWTTPTTPALYKTPPTTP